MHRMLRFSVFAAVVTIGMPADAAVVTQCMNDRGAGGGLNLADAIRQGGVVTFDCKGAATIQMSATHQVERDVVIDGGGVITLRDGTEAMFASPKQGASIELKGLKFQGTKQQIIRQGFDTTSAVIISGSTFTDTEGPFTLQGPVTVKDSVFTNTKLGAVTTFGTLSIERSRFEGTREAPAVAVLTLAPDATTRIVDSVFTGNFAGAVSIVNQTTDRNHTLEIVRGFFSNNSSDKSALVGAGNGAVSFHCGFAARNCIAKISSTRFANNKTNDSDGGALHFLGVVDISIRNARFDNNSAQLDGGAISSEPTVRVQGGGAPNPNAATNAKLQLQHTVFKNNRARAGGAVSTVRGNIVGQAVTFVGNQATETGGAVFVREGALRLARAVFVENRADKGGSAVSLQGLIDKGGGPEPPIEGSIFANTLAVRNSAAMGGTIEIGDTFNGKDIRLINATIMDNTGAGIQIEPGRDASRPITLQNTIIASNSLGNCSVGATAQQPGAIGSRFINGGNNLLFPTNTCAADIPVAKPNLDTLYLPVLGSPAKSNGDNATCLADPVSARDVYGKRRPQGASCSIGAAEGDLEKEVADRTVGGPAWPPGTDQVLTQPNQASSAGRQPANAGNGSNTGCCCCCLFSCGR